jgi:hypothetical protein
VPWIIQTVKCIITLANLSSLFTGGCLLICPPSPSRPTIPRCRSNEGKKKSTCRVWHPPEVDFYKITEFLFFFVSTFALTFDLFQDIFYFEKRKRQKKNIFTNLRERNSSSRHSHTHFDIHLYIYIYIYRNVEILLTLFFVY